MLISDEETYPGEIGREKVTRRRRMRRRRR